MLQSKNVTQFFVLFCNKFKLQNGTVPLCVLKHEKNIVSKPTVFSKNFFIYNEHKNKCEIIL